VVEMPKYGIMKGTGGKIIFGLGVGASILLVIFVYLANFGKDIDFTPGI